MTFDEIVAFIAEDLGLLGNTEAIVRIGKKVNRRYRKVTSELGMITSRRVLLPFTAATDTPDQTITPCENVLSVTLAGATRPLDYVQFSEMQMIVPRTGNPTRWSKKTIGATSVVLRFDSTFDTAIDMTCEVEDVGATLSGTMVPAFPESYHDILVYGATADELSKKEKALLKKEKEQEYEAYMGKLRLHVAVNGWQDFMQGKTNPDAQFHAQTALGGGSSSSGVGTVTHTAGALTLNQLVLGAGGADIKALGSNGTTGQFLRATTGGAPLFAAIAESDVTNLVADLALKAPLASPALTGNPTAPTQAPGNNTTRIATTAFVTAADVIVTAAYIVADALKANIASPTFTGVPAAPTAAVDTNTTQLATTAYVQGEINPFPAGAVGTVGVAVRAVNNGMYSSAANSVDFTSNGVKALGIDSTQFIDSPTQPRCVAYNNASQTVTAGNTTILTLNSEDVDTTTMHDTVTNNDRVVVPTGGDGYYTISAYTQMQSSGGAAEMGLQLKKNGTTVLRESRFTVAASGAFAGAQIVWQGNLVAGDYVDLLGLAVTNSVNFGSATRSISTTLEVMKSW